MAEPVRNDEPLSSTRWPESPSSSTSPLAVPSPNLVGRAALLSEDTPSRPPGEWPRTDTTEAALPMERAIRTRRAEDAGEAVGSAIGAVVNEARELPTRLKRRFQVIVGGGSSGVKARVSQLSAEAEHTLWDAAQEAGREARQWKMLARSYARRFPFQFVAGAAAAGFFLGVLLRLGREE